MKIKPPTEAEEQKKICEFLRERKIPFYAIPNSQQLSGANRTAAVRVMGTQKALGLSPGVPDMCIFLDQKVLYIELKRVSGGVVSKVQTHWITLINQYDYAEAFVCRGAAAAIKVIEDRL